MPTAYSGVDIGLQDAFWELICADEDLLRLEFDEIVCVEIPRREGQPGPSRSPHPTNTAQSPRRLATRPPRKPGGSERAPPRRTPVADERPTTGWWGVRTGHGNGASERFQRDESRLAGLVAWCHAFKRRSQAQRLT